MLLPILNLILWSTIGILCITESPGNFHKRVSILGSIIIICYAILEIIK